MHCETAATLLGAWRDGELNLLTRWRVGRHVRQCASCASEVAALDALTARVAFADPLKGYDLPRGLSMIYGWRYAPAALAVCALYFWVVAYAPTTESPHRVRVASVAGKLKPTSATLLPQVTSRVSAHPATLLPPQLLPIVRRQKRHAITPRRRVTGVALRHRQRFVMVKRNRRRSLPPVASAVPQKEVIQVSVKISDWQDVVREAQAQAAEVRRVEAEREFISVAVTPEPFATVPSTAPDTSREIGTETDAEEKL